MALRRKSLLCVVFLTGCTRAIFGQETRMATALPGDATQPADRASMPQHPKVTPTPSINATLIDDTPPRVTAAYRQLLQSPEQALGTACGPTGGATTTWSALSDLVNANRTDMLRDLSTRAATTEARAAAIIGLAKVRSVSYGNAEYLLQRLPGTLTTCVGSDTRIADGSAATDLLYVPVVGQTNELPIP